MSRAKQIGKKMGVTTKIETSDEVTRRIEFQIPKAVLDKRYDQELRRACSYIQLKGFRKGKAPRNVVEQFYGGSIRSEVLSSIIDESFKEAVLENALNIVGAPRIDITDPEKTGDLVASAEVSLFPDPEIKNYFDETFSVEVDALSDDDIEAELKELQKYHANYEDILDRTKVIEGDVVVGDYQGYVDGAADERMKMSNAMVDLAKDQTKKEFITGLVDKEIGATADITVSYGEDAPRENLKNKDVVFKFTITKIQKRVLAELDDELAKKSGRAQSLAELRDNVAKRRRRQVKKNNRDLKEEKLYEELIKKNTFIVPQALIDEQIKRILLTHGMVEQKSVQSHEFNVEPYREHFSSYAETMVRRAIITEKIIKNEKIEISDEAVNSWLDKQAEEMEVSRKEVDRNFNYPEQKAELKRYVAYATVVDKLLDKAKITEMLRDKEAK
ncbi:MAG: trigger factor [Deltaproteobacteria bacterium]|nr:trigger factor [Deltaproteobacteria bacterium]